MKNSTLKKDILWIFTVAMTIVIFMCLVFTTGAFFTDSNTGGNSQTLIFGNVSVNITGGLTLTTDDLIPGNTIADKTITFTNTGTVDAYICFSCTITLDGNPITKTKHDGENDTTVEFLTFTVSSAQGDSNSWSSQAGGYYFYSTTSDAQTVGVVIAPNASKSAVLHFTKNVDFGNELSNNTVDIVLNVQTAQADNQAGSTYAQIVWPAS